MNKPKLFGLIMGAVFLGLSIETHAELVNPMLVSLGKPVTGSVYFDTAVVIFNPAKEVFPWSNVNDGYFDDSLTSRPNPQAWSYWLTPDNSTGWFIIDLLETSYISYFEIQNTRNRDYGNDRTSKDFHISLSSDGATWTNALTGVLINVLGAGKPIPIETFSLQTPISARYVKFDLDSFLGGSGGLNELSVYGATPASVPLPASIFLFATGLAGFSIRGIGRKIR